MKNRTFGAAGLAATLALALGTPAAHAETPPFENCPDDAPNCFTAVTHDGTFQIGSLGMRISGVVLSGGLLPEGQDGFSPMDRPQLTAPALQVPGGLLGVPAIQRLIPGVTDVTATTQLAGTPRVSLLNVIFGEGAGVVLPLKIKLRNVLLGPNCTIGSDSRPILLKLTAGTTAPPPPNQPITGDRGEIALIPGTQTIKTTGTRLVDNAFAVPEATGCSPLGLSLLDSTVSGIVNSRQGLPSAAGRNTAVLQSTSYFGPVSDKP